MDYNCEICCLEILDKIDYVCLTPENSFIKSSSDKSANLWEGFSKTTKVCPSERGKTSRKDDHPSPRQIKLRDFLLRGFSQKSGLCHEHSEVCTPLKVLRVFFQALGDKTQVPEVPFRIASVERFPSTSTRVWCNCSSSCSEKSVL